MYASAMKPFWRGDVRRRSYLENDTSTWESLVAQDTPRLIGLLILVSRLIASVR